MATRRDSPSGSTGSVNIGARPGTAAIHETIDDPVDASDGNATYAFDSNDVQDSDLRAQFPPLPPSMAGMVVDKVTFRVLLTTDLGAISPVPETLGRDIEPYLLIGGVEYPHPTTFPGSTEITFPFLFEVTWERNPADPAQRFTASVLDGASYGQKQNLGSGGLLVTSVERVISHQEIAGEAPEQAEIGSRRLHTYERGFHSIEFDAPIWFADVDIGEDILFVDPDAPSPDGEGWTDDDPVLGRLYTWDIVPGPGGSPTFEGECRNMRRTLGLLRHWETGRSGVSPGSTRQGVAIITLGGTRTFTRATPAWIRDPGAAASGALLYEEVGAGIESDDADGLLTLRAATNVMPESSAVNGLAGLGGSTIGVTLDSSDRVFSSRVTPQSWKLTGDGTNVPVWTDTAVATITGWATASVAYKADSAQNLILRISRSSDGFFLKSDGTWAFGTQDITVGASTAWAHFQFAYNGGGAAETYTVYLRGNANTLNRTWHVGHVQVEAGKYATRPVVTAGAAGTRNVETRTLAQPAGKQVVTATGFTFGCQLITLWNTADIDADRTLWHVVWNGSNEAQLRYSQSNGRFELVVKAGGTTKTAYKAHTVVRGTMIEVAARMTSAGVLSVFLDGTKGTDDTLAGGTLPTSVDGVSFHYGHDSNSAEQLDGGMSFFTFTPLVLGDEESARGVR